MKWTAVSPEEVKAPPATSWPSKRVNACTAPFRPAPRACQVDPSQRAIEAALTPLPTDPAKVNAPPAMRSPSRTASACTAPFTPSSSEDQSMPSQAAMCRAWIVLAAVN
jgi:hypothetical protein